MQNFDTTHNADVLPGCRLVLALHNHQPVGNFDSVIQEALEQSYRPFLQTLSRFPSLRAVIHTSGCLLEWLVANAPDYVDELRAAVGRGQVEILGGPIDEPILAAIPRRDRIGQIRKHTELIEEVFNVTPAGMWVPERVWEHSFAGDVTAAGIQYTVLDDSHFRDAGLPEDELYGTYVSEDEGRVLRIFSINEQLRYIIPFHTVDEVIGVMRDWSQKHPNGLMVFGDDGEKFGAWPGTQESVYEEGWLQQFFERLESESNWLQTVTFNDVAATDVPLGRISLPDTSYREMTEWVLPADRQTQLVNQRKQRPEHDPDWSSIKDFVRGGTWRNFLTKYPEAADMANRMKEVSARLQQARQDFAGETTILDAATRALYRGQCNCPYWHGAFGGLYLSHLRQATYRNLIEADTLLTKLTQNASAKKSWVGVESYDFNFDLRPEVKIQSDRLCAYIAPSAGGQIYELDVRGCGTNLGASLARRPEPYHSALTEAGRSLGPIVTKEDGLADHIEYDDAPHHMLSDFLIASTDAESDIRVDLADRAMETRVRDLGESVECEMTTSISIGHAEVELTKTVSMECGRSGDVVVHYALNGLRAEQRYRFGTCLHLAGIAANADDRYLYDEHGAKLGPVNSRLDLDATLEVGAVDEWLGLGVTLSWTHPASVHIEPIETVSGSEGGVERTYQSTRFAPCWDVVADEDGCWQISLKLSCDTSAADARKLGTRELVAV